MGFSVRRTLVIEFEEKHPLHGAMVRVRAASIETMEAVEAVQMQVPEALPLFLDHVVDWNLETADGTELDFKDIDAVNREMELQMARALISQWWNVAVGVQAPLVLPSGDGQPSPEGEKEELSIPMDMLSDSPEKQPEPSTS